jgi:hypothetical protein
VDALLLCALSVSKGALDNELMIWAPVEPDGADREMKTRRSSTANRSSHQGTLPAKPKTSTSGSRSLAHLKWAGSKTGFVKPSWCSSSEFFTG